MPSFRYVKNIQAVLDQMARLNIWSVADVGAPVNGTSGTGVGMLGPGSVYTDTATGLSYVNTGTLLSPIWTGTDSPVGLGVGGLGVVGNAKMVYDFAVDGGVQGAIIPANSPTLPLGAIILGGVIDVVTQLTSGGSATIALGTSAGSSATSLLAATAVASWTVGVGLVVIPKFTAATFLKLTAAGRPNLTIATADLLTGKFNVNLLYIQGS